jgi:hypothetical protein
MSTIVQVTQDHREKILDAFMVYIQLFAANGAPMVFGRLEGMKEAVDVLDPELGKELLRMLKDNYSRMARRTE